MMQKQFHYSKPFQLESGTVLPGFHLAYTTAGKLNDTADNVVWIFHALTANSDPAEWWPGLVGENKLFDQALHFIVCVNIPGSCYGSIGPLDINVRTGEPFYYDFPWFTTRDMIRAYQHLRQALGIRRILAGIGGSMGGQQLLEWAIEEPQLFEHIIPIATNAVHSPWGIAFNATQRSAIENDPTWKQLNERAGIDGMRVARAVALLSYRNYHTYHSQEGVANENGSPHSATFRAETYQKYQGEKLARRFNAFSYYFLSRSMDAHDVGRGRQTVTVALQMITARTLVIAISSDILFPVAEQEYLAGHIPGAELKVIPSYYGHDGFLLEDEQITNLVSAFLSAAANDDRHKNEKERAGVMSG